MVHSDHFGEASGNDLGFITGGENYNSYAAGTHIVSQGWTTYTEKTKSNSTVVNTYDGKNELSTSGTAVVGNTYAMEDNKVNIPDVVCDAGAGASTATVTAEGMVVEGQYPSHQGAEVQYSGVIANGGRYKTGGVINDANLTTSMRAEANAGGVGEWHSTFSEAGFDKSKPTKNYEQYEYGHTGWYDMNQTGYEAAFDMEYKDHSTPFEFLENSTRMQNSATNVSRVEDLTQGEFPVNQES